MTAQSALEQVEDGYPLSALQAGMLFHGLEDPSSGIYVNQTSIEISDDLDTAAFRDAWDRLVARHAALRTSFLWDGLDQPLQLVERSARLPWTEHDWTDIPPEARNARLRALLADDRKRGFDLDRAPLTRMTLIKTGPSTWRWIWTCHHLVADGWSARVLLDELQVIYRTLREGGEVALPEPFPYRDFVAAQLGRDSRRDEAFWRERLSGFATPHRLEVAGHPAGNRASGYEAHTATLNETLTARLQKTAGAQQVTLNTAVMGAWAVVLARWTRERDIVFGATTSGRSAAVPGIERGIGLFVNTLPVRVQLPWNEPLGGWLRDLQRRQLEAVPFEQTSLASIQRWSDVPPGRALFESIFVFENQPDSAYEDAEAAPLRLRGVEFIEHSNYPLALLVIPGESLSLRFIYDTSRFPTDAIESLGAQMLTVLDGFADEPGSRLSELPLVSAPERQRLRRLGAGPDPVDDDRVAHEIIAEVARQNPAAVAVIFEDQEVTYAELDERATQLASRLQRAGAQPNLPIGLLVSRSVEMVVGILGILKAGAAYVPLDPSYPPAHVAGLLADDAITIVVTTDNQKGNVPGSVEAVVIDDGASHSGDHDLPNVRRDDLAYVLHTSGSTGRPKGVMVTHHNLMASTLARDVHYRRPVERFLLLSSFAFDSSVAGIFWTLFSGGTLVLPSPGLEHDVGGLLQLASDRHVTHLLCLPALYQLLLEDAADGQLDALQVGIVAGEACPPALWDVHRERIPDAELHNEYGPTEGTVWATVHRAGSSDRGEPLPIGRPIAGATVHLLDEHGNLVPTGFPGELCVSGAGVARGYLGRPDLTAERFVTVALDKPERIYRTGDLACFRPDGALLFLGRADHQLKIRGHRVESGAVEAVLRSRPGIREAAVAARRIAGGSTSQLIGYLETASDVDIADLRRDLEEAVPDFMIPTAFVTMDELPRLPNGKIDYRALPDPRPAASTEDSPVVPRNEAEALMASIWSDLLGVETVGVRDDFFALGGDSIISIQMISRARQAGFHIQPGLITSHPTIEGLVAAAGVTVPEPASHEPVKGPVPLGPMQRWFFDAAPAVPDHWNQPGLFAVSRDIDPGALEAALQACVDHHDMLRARFVLENGAWRQIIDAERTIHLEIAETASADLPFLIEKAQSELLLDEGRLIKSILLRRTDAETDLLFIAIHHLVMDVVSWAILIEDLETAYGQLASGAPALLAPRTTSFRDWILHLEQQDRSDERDFWANIPTEGYLPLDHNAPGAGYEKDTRVVRVSLDGDATGRLLAEANHAYQTRTEDLIVAALGRALTDWTSEDGVAIHFERHGRPADDIDVSRTVGWFTALHPLYVKVVAGADDVLIKSIKEQLRSVPNGGIGYGALRYLDGDTQLAGRGEPAVLFNYVGRAIPSRPNAVFTWLESPAASARNRANARLHALEVVSVVEDEQLVTEWQYSGNLFSEETIARVAGSFTAHLQRLIDHCMQGDSGGFTPHDFPESGLDQAELDEFLEGLL